MRKIKIIAIAIIISLLFSFPLSLNAKAGSWDYVRTFQLSSFVLITADTHPTEEQVAVGGGFIGGAPQDAAIYKINTSDEDPNDWNIDSTYIAANYWFVYDAEYHPNGEYIAFTAERSNRLRIYILNTTTWSLVRVISNASAGFSYYIAFSDDGEWMAAQGEWYTYIYNTTDDPTKWTERYVIDTPSNAGYHDFSKDDNYLAVGHSGTAKTYLYYTSNWSLYQSLDGSWDASFSPNGQWLATGGRIYRTSDWTQIKSGISTTYSSWSSDSKWFCATPGGTSSIGYAYFTSDWTNMATLTGERYFRQSTFSKDDEYVLASFYGTGTPVLNDTYVWEGPNYPPTASFTYSPSSPYTYETVYFSGKSTDIDGSIVKREWDFDDGYTASTKNPSHAFLQPGSYNVKLKVTDDDGNTDTYTKKVTVEDETPPTPPPAPPPVTPPGVPPPPETIPEPEPPEIPEPKPPEYPDGYTIGVMYSLLKIDELPTSTEEITVMVIDSGIYSTIYTTQLGRLGLESFAGEQIDLDKIETIKHPSFTDADDDIGHGTFVNFEIAYLLQSKLPNSKQISYKIFGRQGETSNTIFMDALREAEKIKPDVISISVGSVGHPEDIFSKEIQKLKQMGIIVICAAGNYGPSPATVLSPGMSDSSICVGSFNFMETLNYDDDEISRWSSRGPVEGVSLKPDCVAPGESIQGPWQFGEHDILSGTSMACPLVSAGTALVIAQHKEKIDFLKTLYFWDNSIIVDAYEEALKEGCIEMGDPNDWGAGIPQFTNVSRIFGEKLDGLQTTYTTGAVGGIAIILIILGFAGYQARKPTSIRKLLR